MTRYLDPEVVIKSPKEPRKYDTLIGQRCWECEQATRQAMGQRRVTAAAWREDLKLTATVDSLLAPFILHGNDSVEQAAGQCSERLVLYHGDCRDGMAAAWSVRKALGEFKTKYLAVRYGEWDEALALARGREVLSVDVALPRDVAGRMLMAALSLVIIDHHKSSFEELADFPQAVLDLERSGAGMAWDILHRAPRPWFIDYVEDRDIWAKRLPNTDIINAYLQAIPYDFAEWDGLQDVTVELATGLGKAVLGSVNVYCEEMAKHARPGYLAGYEVPVLNAPHINISEALHKLCQGHPFAVGWFQRGDGMYQYSLRSDGKIDVSAIAKTYGGGGHVAAAGFQLAERLDLFTKPPVAQEGV